MSSLFVARKRTYISITEIELALRLLKKHAHRNAPLAVRMLEVNLSRQKETLRLLGWEPEMPCWHSPPELV